MKRANTCQMNDDKGLRRDRLIKRISVLFVVSIAVCMFSAQAASFYADEPDGAYALAGEGSGEDITVHFGEAEDQHISIHVNPESDAEAEYVTGIKEVEAGELVTIAPADGSDLPEEAEAAAEIVEGGEAIAAVEEKFPEEASDETFEVVPAQTSTETKASSSTDVSNTDASEPASEAAIAETQYQVFDINLENVDTELYEEGFKVSVNLPEDIKGARDFHLYHLHEGEEPEEIEISTVGSVDKKTGLEVVSGFEFVTEGFSEFVLKYTVDFYWEVNGKVFDFSIPGGGFVSLEHLFEVLGIEAGNISTANSLDSKENNSDLSKDNNGSNADTKNGSDENLTDSVSSDAGGKDSSGSNEHDSSRYEAAINLNQTSVSEVTKKFVAEVVSVEFSNPELVWVGKVDADTTIGSLKETHSLDCVYSADLADKQIEEINAQTVEAGDWVLISLLPFKTEEKLTIRLSDGKEFTIKVTDGQLFTYFISDRGDTYEVIVTYDDSADIPLDAKLDVRLIDEKDEEYAENIELTNDVLKARNEEVVNHPVQFDIAIVSDGVEIEPAEGSIVHVEVRLVKEGVDKTIDDVITEDSNDITDDSNDVKGDSSVITDGDDETLDTGDESAGFSDSDDKESSIVINGREIEYNKEDDENVRAIVAHITDDGNVEIIDEVSVEQDTEHIVMEFDTESFSDYMFGDWNNYDNAYSAIDKLPDQIYVGDEIYFYNSESIWITNIGPVVTETKHNNKGAFKVVRAIAAGSFRVCHENDFHNGDTWYWGYKGKIITVLPARTGTTPPRALTEADGIISNASIGLSLNLFDYDLDEYLDDRFNNYDYGENYARLGSPMDAFLNHGINNNHNLKFWGSGIGKQHGDWNKYEAHGVSSIVKPDLSVGYPKLVDSAGDESLAYLFQPWDGTDKKAYVNADGLFRKVDDYYIFNSNENYAYYDETKKKFDVYEKTYQQKSRTDGGETATHTNGKPIGFFPFHKWDEDYDLYVNWNKNLNHHFGLAMSVDFALPQDPKAVKDSKGNDIVFHFSGDDDLWVFIDGKLAMDLGGIHQPTEGTINFTTQKVVVNQEITDQYHYQNFDFSKLYDGKKHTLQVFYIERGGCDSNCMIQFNITRYGDVEFDKVDKDDPTQSLEGAVFGLYRDQLCTEPLMENLKDGSSHAYIEESDSKGHVSFTGIPLGTYYLRELQAPAGYPVDDTVHTVVVYPDPSGDVKAKVRIDQTEGSVGVEITNKLPNPIDLGVKKEWQNQNGSTIAAPYNAKATFEIKRIRTYEEYEELDDPGDGKNISTLTVGWVHNGQTHIYKEYSVINGTSPTVSWSYKGGYTGSIACIKNGQPITKSPNNNNIYSEAISIPENGQNVTLYIVDDSVSGDSINRINVAGRQFIGNNGGGVIHIFTTVTEPDPDFVYTGDENVNNNRVVLPINNQWEYTFENLPLAERVGNNTYTYSYYIEEVSSEPTAVGVIYKDTRGNVVNKADDCETSETGTEQIINKINTGSLKITKTLKKNGHNDQNATGTFNYAVYSEAYNPGADPAQIPVRTGSIKVTTSGQGQAVENDLPIGTYYVYELTGQGGTPIISDGHGVFDDRYYSVTTEGSPVQVTTGQQQTADIVNNYETIPVTATKSWVDLSTNTNAQHPTIYFKLFYSTDEGDIAVSGAGLMSLPNGTTEVTWTDMPKYDLNGTAYNYCVKEYIQKDDGPYVENNVHYIEAAPNGYLNTEAGLSITNTQSDKYNPRTSYSGRKVWVDPSNNGATRPENLKVTLMVDNDPSGPSNTDVPATDASGNTPAIEWSKVNDEWVYTFSNLPVFDATGRIVHYYAVEDPVTGYTSSDPYIIPTTYAYTNEYDVQAVSNDMEISLSSELQYLPFVAIRTKHDHNPAGEPQHTDDYDGKEFHIWTIRETTSEEKTELLKIFNEKLGSSLATTENTRFISGLPVSRRVDGNVEYLYRKETTSGNSGHVKVSDYKVSIHKGSGDSLTITIEGSEHFAKILVGTLKYSYNSGSTKFRNTLKTKKNNVKKQWPEGFSAPDGAEVQFTLTAVDSDNHVVNLTDIGVSPVTVTLNGGQQDENQNYTGHDTIEKKWEYSWTGLPERTKGGKEITYSASETSYKIGGEPIDISTEGLVPTEIRDGATFDLITTNHIPTEDISAKKNWPEGQTPPEGTKITFKLGATKADISGDSETDIPVDDNALEELTNLTSLDIELDGTPVKNTAVASGELESWVAMWKSLPKYDKNGKKLTYTVTETGYVIGDDNYSNLIPSSADEDSGEYDFAFTNSMPTVEIWATKQWQDEDGNPITGNSIPEGAIAVFDLIANETAQSKRIVLDGRTVEQDISEDEQYEDSSDEEKAEALAALKQGEFTAWEARWKDLPKYDADGELIRYTVKEIESFDSNFVNLDKDGVGSNGIIRNKKPVTTIKIEGKKSMAGANVPIEGAFSFEIQKSNDNPNAPVPSQSTVTNTKENGIAFEFSDIQYYYKDWLLYGKTVEREPNKRTFTYTVREINRGAEGVLYDKSIFTVVVTVTYDEDNCELSAEKEIKDASGNSVASMAFINDEVVDIEATKTWKSSTGDNINSTIANASIKFELQSKIGNANWTKVTVDNSGEAITNPVEISVEEANEDAWKALWQNLPKYSNGTLILYQVVETSAIVAKEELVTAASEPTASVSFPEPAESNLSPRAVEPVTTEGDPSSETADSAESDRSAKAVESIEEKKLIGTANIDNTHPVVDITVKKTWNHTNVWPDANIKVGMQLKANAEIPDNLPDYTTNENNSGSENEEPVAHSQQACIWLTSDDAVNGYTWHNLPKYDNDGKLITYTVEEAGMKYVLTSEGETQEVDINNYRLAYEVNPSEASVPVDGMVTIDNTLKETDIQVTKVWTENRVNRTDKTSINFDVYQAVADGDDKKLSPVYTSVGEDEPVSTEQPCIQYVGGENGAQGEWQVVKVSGLPKYELKISEGVATYVPVNYYVQEAGAGSGSITSTTYSNNASDAEFVTPVDAAINNGTITIFNRDVTLEVLKIDEDTRESDVKTTLSGVVFKLMQYDEEQEGADDPYKTVEGFNNLTTDGKGEFSFTVPGIGKYKLKEVSAPPGYILTGEENVYFIVNSDGTVTWTDADFETITGTSRISYDDYKFTVGNILGAVLPASGGEGTHRIYLMSLLLIALAGIGLVMIRRRREFRW